jgi:hypothetical protein
MGKLEFYDDLDKKKECFHIDTTYFKIDYPSQFKDWYHEMISAKQKTVNNAEEFDTFYRGVNEAKYKLYNTAQRFWIRNNLMQLESLIQPIAYLEMIQNMVEKAKDVRLLQQVFQYYEILPEQMDFPLLSILQHYRAPTPLMDWTYDINIALFFAILDIKKSEKEDGINDYVSIFKLDKNIHGSFLKNNLNYLSANVFPSVSWLGKNFLNDNSVIYISDFEIAELEKNNRKIKPLTTYYNLNILAQKGLFVFNPSENMPLEAYPDLHHDPNVDNKIFCYNINKDLSELIKYWISKEGVDFDLIFPNLEQYSRRILDDYMKSFFAEKSL